MNGHAGRAGGGGGGGSTPRSRRRRDEHLAGREAGVVGQQETDRPGDFLGLADAPLEVVGPCQLRALLVVAASPLRCTAGWSSPVRTRPGAMTLTRIEGAR